MREGAKRRLAGAVVVVSLAVIFVPMLFDNDSMPPPLVDNALLTEPNFASRFDAPLSEQATDPADGLTDDDMPMMDADLSLLGSEPTTAPSLTPVPVAVPDEPARWNEPVVVTPPGRIEQSSPRPVRPAVTTMKPVTATRPVTTTKPAAPAKPVVKPKPAPPEKAAPKAKPPADEMSTWVVQVASLGSAQMAADLQKKLRSDGFSAFVEKAQVRGKTYYRVRVGPNADRSSAEKTASRIRQKQNVEPLVQRYQK